MRRRGPLAASLLALTLLGTLIPVALGADDSYGLASTGVGAGLAAGADEGSLVSSSGSLPPPRIVASAPAPAPAIARVIRHGSRAHKLIALTFDDGYSPPATLAIVKILRSEHVAATFFPYARAAQEAPSLWRQISRLGFPVGNHTFSHANLTRLSPAAVRSQLTRARAVVRSITGEDEPAIARPPYGAYTAATRVAAARAGYPTLVLWDVDTRDWSGISAATIVSRAIKGTNGSIVLMHAGPANTPRALRAIIRNYRARGYEFVTVPALLGMAWPSST